jgi:hypothetical protein
MRYQIFACALSVFAALGCGAAEDGENVGESQEAINLLGTTKVLRQNTGGNCIEKFGSGFKVVSCTYPYPSSKKWEFEGTTATGWFRVRLPSSSNGACASASYGSQNGDPLIQQPLCAAEAYSLWRVLPGSGSLAEHVFQLQNNRFPSFCMTVGALNYLTLSTCIPPAQNVDTQRLLLDDF